MRDRNIEHLARGLSFGVPCTYINTPHMHDLGIAIQEIARGAGAILRDKFRRVGVHHLKADETDVVTEADYLANDYILKHIHEQFPDHGIISEETGEETPDAEYVWVIDPLDGTRNFATHVPIFGVMIAIVHRGEVSHGVIYDPTHDELAYAKKGEGAFINGERVQCSQKTDLNFTFGASASEAALPIEQQMMRQYSNIWVSKFSCSAMSSLTVAAGRRDWKYDQGKMAGVWDHAPGALLLAEAGCVVTDLRGNPWTFGMKETLAANPALHAQLLALVHEQ